MDILGMSRRMFDQFAQTNSAPAVPSIKEADTQTKSIKLNNLSSMTERVNHIAVEFDVRALPVSEVLSLQSSLTESGLIQTGQVRAQGLLTQLAYKHYESGPMDLEKALVQHVDTLKDKPAVLADHQEGKQLLNTVRNLISAREQQTHAA